jgi:signal transduction histidine kinase/FixJ family two-component response regulator
MALATRREAILDAMMEAAESFAEALDSGWAERLLDSLIAEVTGTLPDKKAFLWELDHLVRPMVSTNSRVGRWQNVVSALRRQMLPCFDSTDTKELCRAQDLWAQARVLIGEAAQQARGYQIVQERRQTQTLRQISQSLVAAFDVAELADTLARDLPSLGIECCYLSLYEDPKRPTDRARLIMAYDGQGRIELAQDGQTYSSEHLVPTDLLSRTKPVKPYSMIAVPLYFREEQIGFALFGVGPIDGTVYEVLRGQISSALKGALLFGETREARAAAEAANQAKSQFLANISHELRTPLHAILGFAELMVHDKGLTDRQRVNSEIIERSGEHLLALINDVLDLAKIEAGKVELQPTVFDLHHMILGLSEMFGLRARQKGLTVAFDLAPGVPQFVCADEGKLRQVLINLLGNAAKFTERGNITLRVKSRQLESGRGNVDQADPVSLSTLCFEIQDTGVGISSDELEGLFDAFVQTESGRRSGQGTGLGLPISREYVRLMGGELVAQSHIGQGSTFRFDLPTRVIDEEQTHLVQPARRVVGLAREQASPDGGPYRLLVVDHDEAHRRLLVELLTPLGFAVQEARSGREAVDIWRAWRPHLIWMDANMPVLDGLDATQEIKRNRESWKTIVVLVTASAFDLEQQLILTKGGDDIICKPFRETQILETLSRHLGVRYVYEDDRTQEPGQLDPALLHNVSQEWRSAMRRAMVIGDVAKMSALIDQLPGPQSLLDELRNRVYRFEYGAILSWIQGEQDR